MATSNPECTVVAVYQNRNDAQSAESELKSSGFIGTSVYLGQESSAGQPLGSAGSTSQRNEGGLKGWFHSLFGTDEHADRPKYESALAGGNVAVSVETTAAQANAVSNILQRFSPLDVHTEDTGEAVGISTSNENTFDIEGTDIDPYAQPAAYSMGGPIGVGVSEEERAARAAAAGVPSGNRSAVRVYPRSPAADNFGNTGEPLSSDSDADFRGHFTSNYAASGANFDDYAPAYRYGSGAAGDARFRGQEYSQVENDLRSDYGQRYPNSTWEHVKDSVRYGWDKMTGKVKSATSTK